MAEELLIPFTHLDAVNVCLRAIGEPRVESLDTGLLDAEAASDDVNECSLILQSSGWHWNTERPTLTPDVDGFINLPANTLEVDTRDDDVLTDVVQRGSRLYNVTDNTYVFTKDMKLTLKTYLDFDDLPIQAKIYVAYSAAALFQQRQLGTDTLNKDLTRHSARAWASMFAAEARVAQRNVNTSSWSTLRILERGSHSFSRGAYNR